MSRTTTSPPSSSSKRKRKSVRIKIPRAVEGIRDSTTGEAKKTLYKDKHLKFSLHKIKPNGHLETGWKKSGDSTSYIRIEDGAAIVSVDNTDYHTEVGEAVMIPPKSLFDVCNLSAKENLTISISQSPSPRERTSSTNVKEEIKLKATKSRSY